MSNFRALIGLILLFGCPVSKVDSATFTADSVGFDDVQAAVNAARSGDTVSIPAGSAVWTQTLHIDKGIHLQGAGAGGYIGQSHSFLEIGTGSKVIATQSGIALQPGQIVRVLYTGDGSQYMEGSVIDYSGTSLRIDVTVTNGGGSFTAWTLAVPERTLIINDAANDWDKAAIILAEDVTHHTELSGIRFTDGTVTKGNHINVYQEPNGLAVRIHDCWFSVGGGLTRAVHVRSKRGIIYRNSFDSGLWKGPGLDNQAVAVTVLHEPDSWTTPDTMGIRDITGLNNFYVEDNYFAAIYLQALDFDSNSRTVVRHNIFNNSAVASHGPETSPDGLRHFELYDNVFVYDDMGDETYPLNWWLYLRGGTGVVTDNVMPNINSQVWSDKPEIGFIIQNIRRNVGPYAGWEPYPSPRQIGQGHDGSAPILDPVYIWSNSRPPVVGIIDYQPDEVGKNLHTADYVQANRDFHENLAKPGYAKYPYPHPLNGGPPTSIFSAQMPAAVNLTDGLAYELGLRFRSSLDGRVTGIRFWKDINETGAHIGRIWSADGQPLSSVLFSAETTSGWQSQELAEPVTIKADTEYTVSVNSNDYYVATSGGLGSVVTNASLTSVAGGNGVYGLAPGTHPSSAFNNTNYFRDIFFKADHESGLLPETTLFTTQQPANVGLNDGTGYELGLRFRSIRSGRVTGIRFWKDANETGSHIGQIWSDSGELLAAVEFGQETAAGWQSQRLDSPLPISANRVYTVSVNAGSHYVASGGGLNAAVANAGLSSVHGGNGVYNPVIGDYPVHSFNDTNYFRDVFFQPDTDSATEPPSGDSVPPTGLSIFTTEIPQALNLSDGVDYELGMRFRSAEGGNVVAIRYWKDSTENGTHVGRIWSSSGELLAAVHFVNEGPSGWQSQSLDTPLPITANTEYTVSVNANTFYVATSEALSSAIANGALTTVAGGNGVYGPVGAYPTASYKDTNYFRDVIFDND